MSSAESRRTFFRQNTWMMTATVVSGAMMFLVHPLNNQLSDADYTALNTLLQLFYWVGIPAVGLQMVFAQLTASAENELQIRELHGAVRGVVKATFLIWLSGCVAVFAFRAALTDAWELRSQWPLWITMLTGLLSLWLPIAMGLLQGREQFGWFGWATMSNALIRVCASYLIVFLVSATAFGVLIGVFLGVATALGLAAWESRAAWIGEAARFKWTGWLRRVVMLTMGFGSLVLVLNSDVMMISPHFPENQSAGYAAGAVLARAIVQFTAPLAVVMFPKVVRGIVRSEETDTFKFTVMGVVILACVAALGLTLVAPLVFRIVFPKYEFMVEYMAALSWAMVPLAVANVLLSNLMARSRFLASPFLLAVAVGYVAALATWHDSIAQVIGVVATFNSAMLLVTTVFTVWKPASR